jgi:hypothetical protein
MSRTKIEDLLFDGNDLVDLSEEQMVVTGGFFIEAMESVANWVGDSDSTGEVLAKLAPAVIAEFALTPFAAGEAIYESVVGSSSSP